MDSIAACTKNDMKQKFKKKLQSISPSPPVTIESS